MNGGIRSNNRGRGTGRRARLLLVSAVIGSLAVVASPRPQPTEANHIGVAAGQVFAGVGNGKIKRFTPAGALLEVLDTQSTFVFQDGMCFDQADNLRATSVANGAGDMTRFSPTGALVQHPWGSGYIAPASCAVDGNGDVYVGQDGGNRDVLKFNPAGTLLSSLNVGGTTPSGYVEISGTTLFYTADGGVKRWDLLSNSQLPDLASGVGSPCNFVRVRVNGEVLVSCGSKVVRLSSAGSLLQTYAVASYPILTYVFGLSLDPDGTTFWTADRDDIVRINIATGAQVSTFNAAPGIGVIGLTVYGTPLPPSNPVGVCANPPPPDRVGTPGNDFIFALPNEHVIYGNGGKDTIFGTAGNDFIVGGPLQDVLFGQDGNDTLCGFGDIDVLFGGDGDDQLFGGDGNDLLYGGPGANTNNGGNGSDQCQNGTPVSCP